MAVAESITRPDIYPATTKVKVFVLSSPMPAELANLTGNPENYRPALVKLEEGTVTSGGVLALNLAAGVEYLLWAEVSSKDVYLRIRGGAGAGSTVVGSPTKVAVKSSGTTSVLAANPSRRGLEIRNTTANVCYLQLGTAAAALGEGIYLAKEGGSWDGLVGPEVWTGAVQGIMASAEGNVTVAEV